MPYSPMKKSCIKMYDKKGKQTGLMMEGSVAHMETIGQEKKNLMKDMPIDNRGVGQMSPYKLDDPDPKEKKPMTNKQKLKAAGAAIGEDVSFVLKTFDDAGKDFDPRSFRYVDEVKSKLKKQKPNIYKNLYSN